jgi:parallel beta-helix repeat protein
MVAPARYKENINFNGKAITVKSKMGPHVTIIDGGSKMSRDIGSVVTFANGEGPTSIISGFTIRDGVGTLFGSIHLYGGGIICDGSSPTITNNIISDNFTDGGGGIFCLNGSQATIVNNIIMGNYGGDGGGGIWIWDSTPSILNNNIIENGGSGITITYDGDAIISNNTITKNWNGGGINGGSSSPIINTIVRDNEDFELSGSFEVSYSNIGGGWPGEGNIDENPMFRTFKGYEYLLHPMSPCVDSGDPSIEDDLYDWHPKWPDWYQNGLRSDMGAYGGPGNVGWLK